MLSTLRNFSELHLVAIPVNGTYKDYIGTAQISDNYTVKVMRETGNLSITNKGKTTNYEFKQGYVMIKPLIDQFQIDNPNARCKSVKQWQMSNKKLQGQDLDFDYIITIKGSSEVKGTYFHPSIVSEVLAWVCEDLKKMIFSIFENAVIDRNQQIQNEVISQQEEVKTGMISASNNYIPELTADNIRTFQSRKNVRFEEPEESEEESISEDSDITTIVELQQKRDQLNNEFNVKLANKQYDQLEGLNKEIDLLDKQIKQMNSGSIYCIKDKKTGKIIYFGQAKSKSSVITNTQEQERFKTHWQQVQKIFKNADFFHCMIAGRLAEYGCQNGIKKHQLDIADFKKLFDIELLQSGIQIGAQLDELESEYIKNPIKYVQQEQLGTVMNTTHNPIFKSEDDEETKSKKSKKSRQASPIPQQQETQQQQQEQFESKKSRQASPVPQQQETQQQEQEQPKPVTDKIICEKCNKQYKTKATLKQHQKICKQ